MSLADNVNYSRRLAKLSDLSGLNIIARDLLTGISSLRETVEFGSNPGALRMLTFVPENLPALVRSSSRCVAADRRQPATTTAQVDRRSPGIMASHC
jgi:hypothetical protein